MKKKHFIIIIIITKIIANILIIFILFLIILILIIPSDVDCNHCKLEKLEQPRGEVIFYNGLNKEEVDFLCSGFSLCYLLAVSKSFPQGCGGNPWSVKAV